MRRYRGNGKKNGTKERELRSSGNVVAKLTSWVLEDKNRTEMGNDVARS